jgi:[acyl-carrier-protein] S-malonyltransferase
VVEAVNFNAPGQVVIAGEASAVNRAIDTAKALGAKRAILLPVSVPSHCALMKPAAEALATHFETVHWANPTIPVVQNVDAHIHADIPGIKAALVAQLYHPVLWVRSIQALAQAGVRSFVECGPGKVLTGLNKRILAEGAFASLEDQASFNEAHTRMH